MYCVEVVFIVNGGVVFFGGGLMGMGVWFVSGVCVGGDKDSLWSWNIK